MGHLDGLGELPPPARQEVVSPSQSAFGLRAYEDEGEDGEGEAPSEVEEDEFGDEGEDDWDTVSVFTLTPYHQLDYCILRSIKLQERSRAGVIVKGYTSNRIPPGLFNVVVCDTAIV